MLLDTETLAKYIRGQLEIQNQSEGYIFRGEIESVEVTDGDVKVKFAWLAKGEGYPPTGWVNEDELDYSASTMIYVASDIGDNRIAMNSSILGETTVFFPPEGSKLDPAKVEGLQLAA